MSYKLIDPAKEMFEHFNTLVLHPELLGMKKTIEIKQAARSSVFTLLPQVDSHELETSAI